MWGDPSQRGNGYTFAGADPVNGRDPLGLRDFSGLSPEELVIPHSMVDSGGGAIRGPSGGGGGLLVPLINAVVAAWTFLGQVVPPTVNPPPTTAGQPSDPKTKKDNQRKPKWRPKPVSPDRTPAEDQNAQQGGKRYRMFVHATCKGDAEAIKSGGLSAAAATAASRRGAVNRPGSFFTFEITGNAVRDLEATSTAVELALRHCPPEDIWLVYLMLPEDSYDTMKRRGQIEVRPMPGLESEPWHTPETIFDPGGYPLINSTGKFFIVKRFP